jgi:hypothetical protein
VGPLGGADRRRRLRRGRLTWPGYLQGVDWKAWHEDYDRPASELGQRLWVVQQRLRHALGTLPDGPLRAVSLCAGQGRDLIGVLAGHPRRGDVRARLVELDPRNAGRARAAAEAAGLGQVEVVTGDAGLTDHYRGAVPADIVLICGVFANIVDADVLRTIGHCPELCAPGGVVIWTRRRDTPDRVPWIGEWFERCGFEPLWLSEPSVTFAVGVHRFRRRSRPLTSGTRMFTFVGYDRLNRIHGARVASAPPETR